MKLIRFDFKWKISPRITSDDTFEPDWDAIFYMDTWEYNELFLDGVSR